MRHFVHASRLGLGSLAFIQCEESQSSSASRFAAGAARFFDFKPKAANSLSGKMTRALRHDAFTAELTGVCCS
jgi:hypothetical protein